MELKTYQEQALETLDTFFAAYRGQPAGQRDPQAAYRATLGRERATYFDAPGMPGVPYICVRIPTGGGKTLLAAHAVGRINRGLLQQERSLVLWLAPTEQIVSDTLKSLQNRAHPYRQALETSVGGSPVEVVDLNQALSLQRTTLDSSTVVVVATIAALRVTDTTGRRVYASNGRLMNHFSGLPQAALEELREPAGADGRPGELRYSLANVLRLRRPLVIVDEAHNADTPLSFETLQRFAPSCILEMTATPTVRASATTTPSNVIYSVSALQLKAEDMIKMPVKLETHPNWQTIVSSALTWRDRLEEDAQAERELTGETLRPIILYQAQPNSQERETITVETLRHELVEVRRIPEEQVKIATGTLNELQGIDLNDPTCPVRHVITVQALREGWDCPQAYVLCSVATQRSQTAIEQLVGRVLRMPRATRKQTQTLNHAYVFAVSENLAATLRKLGDGLTSNGFSAFEARYLVEAQPLPGLFQDSQNGPLPSRVTLGQVGQIQTLPPVIQEKVQFNPATSELTLTPGATFNDEEAEELLRHIPDMQDQIRVEHLIRQHQASPSERGLPFDVPLLTVAQPDGQPSLFDESVLIEAGWSLNDATASLSPEEYEGAGRPVQRGLIDVDQRGQVVQATDPLAPAQAMLLSLTDPTVTTAADLARWIDRAFRHEDVGAQQSMPFILRLLRYLTEVRRLRLEDLIYDRHRLRDAVERKISSLQKESKKRAYAQLLPGLTVTPDTVFSYPTDYPGTPYEGPHRFQRHYYPRPGDLVHGTEEFDAAVMLDSLPGVRYWVRNLSGRPQHSFWLQTSTDKHYPDLVALLEDGRVVAIEYKGQHLLETPDTQEKKDLGALWTAKGDGRVLYVLLTKPDVPRLGELLGLA